MAGEKRGCEWEVLGIAAVHSAGGPFAVALDREHLSFRKQFFTKCQTFPVVEARARANAEDDWE